MLRPRSERDLTAPASPESQANLQARQRAKKEAALFEQAAALGFACFPIKNVLQEIATAIATRMRTRLGLHIYQSVSHMLPGVPLRAHMKKLRFCYDNTISTYKTSMKEQIAPNPEHGRNPSNLPARHVPALPASTVTTAPALPPRAIPGV